MENTKPPAKRLRLKDSHPVMQKYNQLWELADSLGITLEFYGHRTILIDNETDKCYDVDDIEGSAISTFPYPLEVKLTFDNPAFAEYESKINEVSNRERLEEEKALKKAKAEAEAEAKRKAEEALKKAELNELKRLKNKYGEVEFDD